MADGLTQNEVPTTGTPGSDLYHDLAHLYDLIVQPGPCEQFYRDLAQEKCGKVLELACGTGRLTIPLARDGHSVTGVDSSFSMLKLAHQKSRIERLQVELLNADMRLFEIGARFGLVVVGSNSLAHLITTDDIRACFRCVRRHLEPDGIFAFDIINPDINALAQPPSRRTRLDLGPNPSSAMPIEEESTYDPVTQLRTLRWHLFGSRITAAAALAPMVLRTIYPQELPLLLEIEGLTLVGRYGDFARNDLSHQSLNQVCIARVM
jgi:SAM-dependent methyltransferase